MKHKLHHQISQQPEKQSLLEQSDAIICSSVIRAAIPDTCFCHIPGMNGSTNLYVGRPLHGWLQITSAVKAGAYITEELKS